MLISKSIVCSGSSVRDGGDWAIRGPLLWPSLGQLDLNSEWRLTYYFTQFLPKLGGGTFSRDSTQIDRRIDNEILTIQFMCIRLLREKYK